MNVKVLKKLLEGVKKGNVEVAEALDALRKLPFEELPFATLDSHRALRQGFPEVIFGQGKTIAQIKAIIKSMLGRKENVLITRLQRSKGRALKKAFPKGEYREISGTFFIKSNPVKPTGKGTVLVICAGTSDIPVAEEASTTAECMGNRVKRLYDVGVAGIHRLLHKKEELWDANVLIVVAGMEGALPSVVAGMVARPVIAVPTSVGYGANLGGITTLMAMLNSCAAGISVVNIDNGFGAAYVASLINRE
ncbi:MAG TPA: nickel pincer cofactor biosynthesis protein LarB [Deltaproteobacteria bacterium]|nr:MAG: 1-(5-phosphoribosyl)-5-amino-4-imidazole-carboxylate carboxylase [Deltaproteobacteria bacterium GWA2_55_82]OGQ64946.1 MAG: 1-(5-phosphoribosyl)-5-amino-4-imidazole-carboxylate carboxylase [Deltaproteobacteria bacterium RIFCSPLOWO2_02_FULL_55_12]OIJ73874.1 MAG: 1-(5-phosphoribosyl)-5-amino-4-imidazole-carboxylate carboxylase [Deltaproteobacteria bacterium GWC2_55_46]HBG46307.1 nickel pincer cofactor biosynthesis protein LarB [Deltaproteobacteria bacterium]HCY09863.1 nickel pincer cofacto